MYRIGEFELDPRRRSLSREGRDLHLREKTFRVLLFLLEHRDRVVTRDELMDVVWESAAVTPDALVQSIMEIRRILGDEARDSRFIKTIPKVGYRFIGPVETVRPESEPERRARGRWAAVVAAGLILLVAGVWGLEALRSSSPDPERRAPAWLATADLDARRLYNEAVRKARALQSQEAIDLLEEVIRLDPDFAMAHARIGYAYAVAWGRVDEGLSYLDRALELSDRLTPKNRRYVEGWRAIARLRYGEAIETFRAIVEEFPTDAEAYHQLAKLLAGEERLEESLEVLERGLVADPRAPDLYNLLCGMRSALGDHESAIAACRRYVELLPEEPNALDSLGLAFQWAGRYGEADRTYGAALELDPDFEIAVVHLGNSYVQQGRYRAAIEQYERYLELAGSAAEEVRAHVYITQVQLKRGDIEAAGRAAHRAEEISPLLATQALAEVAMARGDLEKAERLLVRLQEAFPGTERGARGTPRLRHILRGRVALAQGHGDRAIGEFRQALRYRPPRYEPDPGEDCLARAFLEVGRLEEAIVEFESVLERNPRYPLGRFHLAVALERKGDLHRAATEYARFAEDWAEADPDVPELTKPLR